jgi:hypothetical protein
MFPGITIRPTTLPFNFAIPIWGDFLLSTAAISSEKPALKAILDPPPSESSKKKGNAVILAIGGHYYHFKNLGIYFIL